MDETTAPPTPEPTATATTTVPVDPAPAGQLLWPPGGEQLALAAVLALGFICALLAIHVVGSWRK